MAVLAALSPLTTADVTGDRGSALCPRLHPRSHAQTPPRFPSRPHPLRPQPHRLPASAARAPLVLLGLCPSPRRHLRAAHRGTPTSRAPPRGGRRSSTACSGWAWSTTRPVLPDAAHGPLQGSSARCWPPAPPTTATCRPRSLDQIREAQRAPGAKAALRRALAPEAGKTTRRRPVCVQPVVPSAIRPKAWWHGTTWSGPHRDRQRRDGRLHHCARRRHADLQLLRGGGRLGHGHHPSFAATTTSTTPAPDQHPAGARRRGAAVCAPVDDPRRRRHQAVEAPRRGERDAVRRGRLPAGR